MSSLHTRLLSGIAAGAMLLSPILARAQGADVSLFALSAHQLLGSPLTGGSATLNFPQGNGQLVYRLGVEQASGQAERVGVPCAGTIQPGICSPERLHDDARLTSLVGGASVRMLATPRVTVSVEGDAAVASVHVDSRGLTSGYSIAASKTVWGPRLGVNLSWRPMATVPVAIGVGATAGTFAPIAHNQSPDTYAPFEGRFGVRTVHLGLVWQAPVRE
jgi:hypothetical protein